MKKIKNTFFTLFISIEETVPSIFTTTTVKKSNFIHSSHEPSDLSSKTLKNYDSISELTKDCYGFLDMSKCLMQQGVSEASVLSLDFRYYYYPIDLKNRVLLNQMYQKARYDVITRKVRCSESEAILFASLQHQVEALDFESEEPETESLNDLIRELSNDDDGKNVIGKNIIPEERAELEYFVEGEKRKSWFSSKQKIKSSVWAVKDTKLLNYKALNSKEPSKEYELKGCDVHGETNHTARNFSVSIQLVNGQNERIIFFFKTETLLNYLKSIF